MIVIFFRLSYLAEVLRKCIAKLKIVDNKEVEPRKKMTLCPFLSKFLATRMKADANHAADCFIFLGS